jgi:pimeloyl-ACP methyl ester carboxylesterase
MALLSESLRVLSMSVALPILAQSPEADRAIAFEGFNKAPLQASVLAGKGHPYFAVMVAGSGPTDRDWSNPLIGRPSHSGRDVARWLQSQGVGSLRFDKRFIGKTDPTLDISMDAQVGDIRAALKYARTLPEAKGKKLLLLGHSEGAMLALVAAQDADALLLIGLPEKSMGATIRDQVARQLDQAQAPEDARRVNLAYLDQAFEALRTRKTIPAPEAGVAPGLPRLMTMLSAPASVDFVRQTLDLDPWPLLARATQPAMLVWGDHDIQTPAPAELPKGIKAERLLLPGANHVLRKEERDAKTLNTANAGDHYGDDTPLADLSPLAPWFRNLK